MKSCGRDNYKPNPPAYTKTEYERMSPESGSVALGQTTELLPSLSTSTSASVPPKTGGEFGNSVTMIEILEAKFFAPAESPTEFVSVTVIASVQGPICAFVGVRVIVW